MRMQSFLLFLCCLHPWALGCDWLQHYGHFNNISRTLVQTMGGEMTDVDSPVPFPYKLYEEAQDYEVESQLAFIRESFELIFDLYCHDNLSSANWDAVKTEHFRIIIHRQIRELNKCVQGSVKHNRHIRLRKYYHKLMRRTVDCTGGDAESWEILRLETKLHLEQLELLGNSITATGAASRGPSKTSRGQTGTTRRPSQTTRGQTGTTRGQSWTTRRLSETTSGHSGTSRWCFNARRHAQLAH